jgi:mRNA-degrading endonuclease RelE of RelBE toxin-antitoxin system
MSWRVEWTPAALASFHRLPFHDAARVAAAVYRYASTGEGQLVRAPGDDAMTWRLRVGSYRVRFALDPRERELVVWYVYRAP